MANALFLDPSATSSPVIVVDGVNYYDAAPTSQPSQSYTIDAELDVCAACPDCGNSNCSGVEFTITMTYNWSAADYELYAFQPGPPEPGMLTFGSVSAGFASACILCGGGLYEPCDHFDAGFFLDNRYVFPEVIVEGLFGVDWNCDPVTKVMTAYLSDALFGYPSITMDITHLLSCAGGKPVGSFTFSYGSGTTCVVTVS